MMNSFSVRGFRAHRGSGQAGLQRGRERLHDGAVDTLDSGLSHGGRRGGAVAGGPAALWAMTRPARSYTAVTSAHIGGRRSGRRVRWRGCWSAPTCCDAGPLPAGAVLVLYSDVSGRHPWTAGRSPRLVDVGPGRWGRRRPTFAYRGAGCLYAPIGRARAGRRAEVLQRPPASSPKGRVLARSPLFPFWIARLVLIGVR